MFPLSSGLRTTLRKWLPKWLMPKPGRVSTYTVKRANAQIVARDPAEGRFQQPPLVDPELVREVASRAFLFPNPTKPSLPRK